MTEQRGTTGSIRRAASKAADIRKRAHDAEYKDSSRRSKETGRAGQGVRPMGRSVVSDATYSAAKKQQAQQRENLKTLVSPFVGSSTQKAAASVTPSSPAASPSTPTAKAATPSKAKVRAKGSAGAASNRDLGGRTTVTYRSKDGGSVTRSSTDGKGDLSAPKRISVRKSENPPSAGSTKNVAAAKLNNGTSGGGADRVMGYKVRKNG